MRIKELMSYLPDSVPMPEPNQFHKGWYRDKAKRPTALCLTGWCNVVVDGTNYPGPNFKVALELSKKIARTGNPAQWNDKIATHEQIARRWREFFTKHGYKLTEVKR